MDLISRISKPHEVSLSFIVELGSFKDAQMMGKIFKPKNTRRLLPSISFSPLLQRFSNGVYLIGREAVYTIVVEEEAVWASHEQQKDSQEP